MLPQQPIKVEKSAFFPYQTICRTAIRKRIVKSQFRFQKVQYNEFLYTVYNSGGIRSRNLRVYAVNNSTFAEIRQKSEYHAKYLKNILDLPWPTL